MHYTELADIWTPIFMQLGCRETELNNWYFETKELTIVLSLKVNDREKDFFIDIGILFKKLHPHPLVEIPLFDNHDIGQALYLLLLKTGELDYYLNNLFCYHPDVNTGDEIITNSKELANLFKKKVIPLIGEVDGYAAQAENFEEAANWKPFLKYFRAHYLHDIDFGGMLNKLYTQSEKFLK